MHLQPSHVVLMGTHRQVTVGQATQTLLDILSRKCYGCASRLLLRGHREATSRHTRNPEGPLSDNLAFLPLVVLCQNAPA